MQVVDELLLLDDIEHVEREYEEKHGKHPVNVSCWNASSSVIDLDRYLRLPNSSENGSDYIFSYSLEQKKLVQALGFKDKSWKVLVTHSGSSALVSVAKWLSSNKVQKILILAPRYFTIPHLFKSFNIKCSILYCERIDNEYVLPKNINHEHFDAIFITDPICCTGKYLKKDELEKLYKQWTSNKKYFVVDNCLSSIEHFFGQNLKPNPFVSIVVTPNKNICVNAYKFAAVLFHESHLDHFECWSDVFQGCLPESALRAVEWFTSHKYHEYLQYFRNVLKKQEEILYKLLEEKSVEIDKNSQGYFRSIYFPKLDAFLGNDTAFLKKVFFASKASFIPNIRNELDPNSGFSFRINLARFDLEAQKALKRIIKTLATC